VRAIASTSPTAWQPTSRRLETGQGHGSSAGTNVVIDRALLFYVYFVIYFLDWIIPTRLFSDIRMISPSIERTAVPVAMMSTQTDLPYLSFILMERLLNWADPLRLISELIVTQKRARGSEFRDNRSSSVIISYRHMLLIYRLFRSN